MNGRIKQLAEHAGFTEWHRMDNPNGDAVIQAFAELMVQEAIAVVNKRYMGDQNREDMEVLRCVEDLKKHFGVE